MTLTITPLYAALLTLLFIVLSWQVIGYRRAHGISVGDKADKGMIKRMRVQANFVEYTPLGVILLLIAELQGAPALALHLMGLSLLVGRVLHAIGLGSTPQRVPLRQIGMLLTFVMLALSAVGLLGHVLF